MPAVLCTGGPRLSFQADMATLLTFQAAWFSCVCWVLLQMKLYMKSRKFMFSLNCLQSLNPTRACFHFGKKKKVAERAVYCLHTHKGAGSCEYDASLSLDVSGVSVDKAPTHICWSRAHRTLCWTTLSEMSQPTELRKGSKQTQRKGLWVLMLAWLLSDRCAPGGCRKQAVGCISDCRLL